MTQQMPNGKDTKTPPPLGNGAANPKPPAAPLPFDLAALSDEQVTALAAEVPRELERRKGKLLDDLREHARALGLTPERLAAALRARTDTDADATRATDGRHFVRAKYRSPSNPALTWSGRGGEPPWVKDFIAAGGTKEDLLIPEGEE